MKNTSIKFLMIAGLAIILSSFTFIGIGNIRGKVVPADKAVEVLAVLGTDTLRTQVSNGNFAFGNVKTGTYTVVVKANLPFKDVYVKNVPVIDSTTTDVGVVKLLQ